jgi:hypothetical protein
MGCLAYLKSTQLIPAAPIPHQHLSLYWDYRFFSSFSLYSLSLLMETEKNISSIFILLHLSIAFLNGYSLYHTSFKDFII